MSIKAKLILAFTLIVAFTATQAAVGLSQVARLSSITTFLANDVTQRVELVSNLSTSLVELRGAELFMVLAAEPEEADSYAQSVNSLSVEIDSAMEFYEATIDAPEKRAIFEDFLGNYSTFQQVHNRLVEAVRQGDQESAQNVLAASRWLFDEMERDVRELRHQEYASAESASQAGRESTVRARYLFLAAFAALVALAVGIGWFLDLSISRGLRALMAGTRRISQGQLSYRVEVESKDELGDLARAFNTMADSLEMTEEENLRLHQEALAMREAHISLLRDRFIHTVEAQEKERQRVARELHDEAGQALSALQLGLGRLEKDAPSEEVRGRVREMRSLTLETMEEVRRLALDLRPSMLDDLGLLPALQFYIREQSTWTGLPIELEVHAMEGRLPPEVEVALFRIIQEGLTNVVKHAQASHARVVLARDGANLRVQVEDDGRGFDVQATLSDRRRESLGIFGIEERIRLLGGQVDVESEPGKGTRLIISVPTSAGRPAYGVGGEPVANSEPSFREDGQAKEESDG